MYLIASNRSVKLEFNPTIMADALPRCITSGRICRGSSPSTSNWLSVRRLFTLYRITVYLTRIDTKGRE